MSADGKIPAARITAGVRIVVELVHQTGGPRAGQDQPVNPSRKGSGYAATVERVRSELIRPAGGRRAIRRYLLATDLGEVNVAPAETVWVVDALPEKSARMVAERTADLHAERAAAAAAAATPYAAGDPVVFVTTGGRLGLISGPAATRVRPETVGNGDRGTYREPHLHLADHHLVDVVTDAGAHLICPVHVSQIRPARTPAPAGADVDQPAPLPLYRPSVNLAGVLELATDPAALF